MMFDLNWTTAQWAMERNLPIEGDCTNTPGTSLVGFILSPALGPKKYGHLVAASLTPEYRASRSSATFATRKTRAD
jgi:hypothetical protein